MSEREPLFYSTLSSCLCMKVLLLRCRECFCQWEWHFYSVMSILGYLKGGDTFRLLHSHSDTCLTIMSAEQGEELQKSVKSTSNIFSKTRHKHAASSSDFMKFSRVIHYETGSVSSHARSLWRLEILRVVYVYIVSWSAQFLLKWILT